MGEDDAELDDELCAHIDLATAENVKCGMAPEAARTQALRAFGGVAQTRENYRVERGLPWLDGVVQDVRYVLRSLRRSPGFTVTALTMLALGIGANVTVFTLTNALFKRLPFDRNDRILYIHSRRPYRAVSYSDFQDWRAQAKSFEGMGAVEAARGARLR